MAHGHHAGVVLFTGPAMQSWLFIVEVLSSPLAAEPTGGAEVRQALERIRMLYDEFLRQDYNSHAAKDLARAVWLKERLGKNHDRTE